MVKRQTEQPGIARVVNGSHDYFHVLTLVDLPHRTGHAVIVCA
jgi:hypothetical protein